MKIRKLHLKNIGVFDDEIIEFKECPAKDKAEIHILTGENGTGKTTILQALASSFERNQPNDSWDYSGKPNITLKEHVSSFHRNKTYKKFTDKNNSKILLNIETENGLEKDEIALWEFEGYFFPEHNFVDNRINMFRSIADKYISSDWKYVGLEFAAFAYSGYRGIKDEPIEIGKEIEENPLYQALDFIKDENSKFTVNQWLGQNLLNSSLAQTKKKFDEAEQFNKKIQSLENVINDIIWKENQDNEMRFEMQSATKLVLIKNNQELDFDVLPDGLKSLVSWIGDLLMRLDSLGWKDRTPIFDREIILFLDEIEVHLHPAWQRKVLPIVQKLFKNAQIFVSTHSPFVVNSVDDAWVYKLKLDENGKAKVEEVIESENSNSITQVLREIFGVDYWFGFEVQKNFEDFKKLKNKIISNGADKTTENQLLEKARSLADEPNDQLKQMIRKELEELSEIKKKPYKL